MAETLRFVCLALLIVAVSPTTTPTPPVTTNFSERRTNYNCPETRACLQEEPDCTNCPENLSCADRGCKSPCSGFGGFTIYIPNHLPFCRQAYTGDPFTGCSRPKKRFLLYFNPRVTWYTAFLNCRAQGMELASIENHMEFEQIYSLIKSSEHKFEDEFTSFWTAGMELSDTENYIWGTTGKPVNYFNWAYGEPNLDDGYGAQRCISLWNRKNYSMNDVVCSSQIYKQYYVCQQYL